MFFPSMSSTRIKPSRRDHREKTTMDEMHLQKSNQVMEEPQLLRKLIQLLCSISLFSALIWCSHSILSTLSSHTFQVVSKPVDRKFVFLVFNGLLVFIAKTGRNSFEQSGDDHRPDVELQADKMDSDLMINSDGDNLLDSDWIVVDDQNEKDVEEEEDGGELSAEELNKKFEEFIKRMKDEIRFEAREQAAVMASS